MELRQYFNVLIKWWWLIALAVIVAGTSAFLGSLVTPRQYQSRTTLMVGQALQAPNPNQSDLYLGQALAQSYTDLARREPVLRGTLSSLGLNWDWGTLQGMVSSRVVPGTQLIEISVLDTDPQRVELLADGIARQLILQSPAGTDPQMEAERQFTLQQVEDLKNNIEHSQEEIRQLDDVIGKANSARQIQDARTRQDTLRTQISSWQSTYAQLRTSLQQGTPNFLSVVEPATFGWQVGTTTGVNVLIAAVIGLALASTAAFLLEYLDDTLKTPEDVRQVTELVTLGGVAAIEGEDYPSQLITIKHPRSPTAEAFRMLRTNLQFSAVDRPLKTLMITSPGPREGKSLTAANVAVAMAQAGKRVVLVDADLRRPTLQNIFELSNIVGLTTILLDTSINLEDTLQNTAVENLSVITSGPIPPNPSEMLGSKRMGYLIEALQEQSDIVIFDSPPIMAVTDATVLATRLDGMLLVIDYGHTRRGLARRSREALAAVGATVLGVVLNRLPSRELSYDYYTQEDQRESRWPSVAFLLNRRNGQTSSAMKKSFLTSIIERRTSKTD
jgi:succinoglycan biosynthesis transport protein ExoP